MRLSYWRLVMALLVLTVGMMGGTARAQTRDRYGSGEAIAQMARSYVGYGYDYTSDHPPAFSCVGFVRWVYRQYGIWLPGSVAAMAYGYPYVAPQNLQPGDLLLFENTVFWGWSHVAIYLGNGQMIGADNFSVGVHMDSIYDPYWNAHWVRSVRVLN